VESFKQSIGEIRACPALNVNHWSYNAQPHCRTFRSGFLKAQDEERRRVARSLEVSIRFQYQAETVMLEIRDCGRGIPTELLNRLREASSEAGVGLAGMRERLNELNCTLEIESDGHGTSMRAIVPLPSIARAAEDKECRPFVLSAHAGLMAGSFTKGASVSNRELVASGF
jgi:hypothetical protein